MKVSELYAFLDERIPTALRCEWDNDGLMCCPDPDREVRRVLLALDITEDVVKTAVEQKYDVILSHHPLVFRPVKALTPEKGVSRKLIGLVQNGISAMSFHTRLDAVDGGVNDVLAGLLGLQNAETFGPDGEKMGRVGSLSYACGVDEFAARVKEILGAPTVLVSGRREVSRVAVLGGNGDDFIDSAIAAGADTFVSGRLGYHPMTDAPEMGINLIEAGHYFTERPILKALSSLLREAASDMEIGFAESNVIRAI